MQGIQMGMEGPMMSGTWVNPATGHKFTVRDCYFENDQFMVQTTNGQILDYNTIQNYVQCTDSTGKEVAPAPSMTQPKPASNIPDEVASLLVPEDLVLQDLALQDATLSKGLGNINYQDRHIAPTSAHQVDGESDDMRMIDRVLKRHDIPAIETSIAWNVPIKQIETLVDVLGIEPEYIAKYYINKIDMAAVQMLVRESLTNYIKEMIELAPAEPEPIKPEPTPKPIAKKPKARNTKAK